MSMVKTPLVVVVVTLVVLVKVIAVVVIVLVVIVVIVIVAVVVVTIRKRKWLLFFCKWFEKILLSTKFNHQNGKIYLFHIIRFYCVYFSLQKTTKAKSTMMEVGWTICPRICIL